MSWRGAVPIRPALAATLKIEYLALTWEPNGRYLWDPRFVKKEWAAWARRGGHASEGVRPERG